MCFLQGNYVLRFTCRSCNDALLATAPVDHLKRPETDVLGVFQLFAVVALSLLACHALHIMSSCAFHLHTCSSHASEHFLRCPFCIPALRSPPVVISNFFSCVGIKHFRIGPRLAKRPWFTTGRPPVKFRIFWTSFDAPTVNRGTEKASCVLQPNTPPKWPKA